MHAIVIEEPGNVSVQTVDDPAPAAGQVVLAVDRCGICGTDRHILSGDNPFARYPVIPGHEFAGRVVAAGSATTRLAAGQLVAVDPSYYCGWCDQCREGYPNLCPFKGGYGTAKSGALAEFVAVTEASCVPLPDGISAAHGALAEPLACVLHGMDNLGPVLGQHVLVYGAGPIGLLALSLLARGGAASLTVVEPTAARRMTARQLGAGVAAESADEIDPDLRFHVVVDASGNVAAMNDGFTRLRSGGRFLLLGVAAREARLSISPFEINWRELRIIGSMAVRNSFGRAVAMLGAGLAAADLMIGEPLTLDAFPAVIKDLGSAAQLKVQIAPSQVGAP